MAALYLESSAVLCWLLGEPRADEVRRAVDAADMVVSATLTSVEVERALVRAEHQGTIVPADRRRLRGMLARQYGHWAFLALTESVRERASQPFPVEPVRTLDAIHLASALEATELFPDLAVLSFDQRILQNLEPLGLDTP